MATAPEAAASSDPPVPLPRRWKRTKGGDHVFSNESSTPISYSDLVDGDDPNKSAKPKRSYRDTITGQDSNSSYQSGNVTNFEMDPVQFTPEIFNNRITVEYKKVGKHDCPVFKLSKWEEERIAKPWRKGLIVKLLGRKIGYKALETRLNQFWAKDGTLTIIDLGQDFFLVMFTCDTDRDHALTQGPWLIYDHYLTVRQWYPNFQPDKVSLDRVAVWVRFSSLPIEMYDPAFLHFVGDIIGKTIKVDKTTMQHSRGKYARVCVEMDLSKPLPAVFEAQDKLYKIEYEGLHLLCLNCGKFGHMKEGCSIVSEIPAAGTNGDTNEKDMSSPQQQHSHATTEGLWTVVQKGRPYTKKKPQSKPATNRTAPSRNGSRYDILNRDAENDISKSESDINQEIPSFVNTLSPDPTNFKKGTTQEEDTTKGNNEESELTLNTSHMEEDNGNLNFPTQNVPQENISTMQNETHKETDKDNTGFEHTDLHTTMVFGENKGITRDKRVTNYVRYSDWYSLDENGNVKVVSKEMDNRRPDPHKPDIIQSPINLDISSQHAPRPPDKEQLQHPGHLQANSSRLEHNKTTDMLVEVASSALENKDKMETVDSVQGSNVS